MILVCPRIDSKRMRIIAYTVFGIKSDTYTPLFSLISLARILVYRENHFSLRFVLYFRYIDVYLRCSFSGAFSLPFYFSFLRGESSVF